MPLQVYYYLYQGNWFVTAVAATITTVPVLGLSAFLQRYLRETNLAGAVPSRLQLHVFQGTGEGEQGDQAHA